MLLQVIMTGGFGIGGFGAFWSLFKESDLPKALASATIGVGLAYGAKLLLPVHRGTEKRLDKAGKSIDRAIDRGLEHITANMVATATRFEDKYLLCQALECQAFRSEGMAQYPGIFVPLLKEVFVPLSLTLNESAVGYRQGQIEASEMRTELLRDSNQSIWDFLQKAQNVPVFRQLVILAWGGYGKTTLLKHIAYRYGSKQAEHGAPKLIPILLVLRAYKDLLTQEIPTSLPDLIEQHHIPGLAGADKLSVKPGWAREILRNGKALVMFDGFDEVAKAHRPHVANWLMQQMQQYEKAKFIVTSRPRAYREQPPAHALVLTSSLWVDDFNAQQRQRFVMRWYQCQERYAHGGRDTPDVQKIAAQSARELMMQIEAEPDVRSLAKNPLLLNMITTLHRRYPGRDLPQRKATLYQEICQLQLKDRPETRKLETLLTECEPEAILKEIAFAMMQKHTERIECDELLSLTRTILSERKEKISAETFVEQVVEISELIVQQEDEYEFAHLSFQEYLASAYVAAKSERETVLYGYLKEDWWKPTILLYAAQVNPTKLILEAMNQRAFTLAYECMQETRRRIDPELKSEFRNITNRGSKGVWTNLDQIAKQVRDARHADLERYLKNEQWKEADSETYRLMITEVGKDERQWFDPEDFLNFPCEPMRAIDRLWVKHSDGKFGFSVQKEIYLKCGGLPDGWHHHESFDKFGKEVGWIEDTKCLDVRYETSSPKGHLPAFVYVWDKSLLRDSILVDVKQEGKTCWASLFSHPDL